MNTTTYTTYTGTFVKQNGQTRTMTFIKSSDVPSSVTTGPARNLPEGQELVYDIERSGFRVFNWNTIQGIVSEDSVSGLIFVSTPTLNVNRDIMDNGAEASVSSR